MSDTIITAIATVLAALIGTYASIKVAKIGKQSAEAVTQPKRKLPWMGIAIGSILGAAVGFFIAILFLIHPATVIDSMDSMDQWSVYNAPDNAVQMTLVEGHNKQSIKIIYHIVPAGYVGIAKILDSPIPENAQEIRFTYRGEGSINMLEVKVIYHPDANGKSAVFSYDIANATPTDKWKTVSVPMEGFKCLGSDTGCRLGELVVPSQIWKVDFAISSKGGGQAGLGTVTIDQITVH